MSTGYLKRAKNLEKIFGQSLETMGSAVNKFFDAKPVQDIIGAVGQGVGMAIPGVGGFLGKAAAKTGVGLVADVADLASKAGKAMQGKYDWKDIGKDIIDYIPNKIEESTPYKVITGQTTIPDAIINALENSAYINYLAPNRTHAWKDEQGNYHRQWQPGTKMVVGEWKDNPSSQRTPITDNGRVTGVGKNGEVFRNGI